MSISLKYLHVLELPSLQSHPITLSGNKALEVAASSRKEGLTAVKTFKSRPMQERAIKVHICSSESAHSDLFIPSVLGPLLNILIN